MCGSGDTQAGGKTMKMKVTSLMAGGALSHGRWSTVLMAGGAPFHGRWSTGGRRWANIPVERDV